MVRAMDGYAGKILRIDLTDRKTSTINTKEYEQWVGGHGMGSAIFWDLVKDKTINGFDPRNVITIMVSPLSGTLVPGASARTEVQGIGVQSSPIEWFTRSNFGGRFGPMLKYAGWDGIVIEGKADKPVWVDIRNEDVKIKDAKPLWGLDTWKTQEEVWREVSGRGFGGWIELDSERRTTQRPAVLTIGPAGENLSRIACLLHDAGNASGQGGFGGIWGAKNLKAISVIGTGSIQIADPKGLMEARLWAQEKYATDLNKLDASWFARFGRKKPQLLLWDQPEKARLQACIGCHLGCKERSDTGYGNESTCDETAFYTRYDKAKHGGKQTSAAYLATDLLQKYGINAYEASMGLNYIRALQRMGVLGYGKKINCPLDFRQLGEIEFADRYLNMIAFRKGIGDDFAEGFFRAAKRWDRLEEDLKTGILYYSYWGLPEHGYDPRAEVEWGYGSILGDRDINEHDFNFLFWWPSGAIWAGKTPQPPAEQVVKIIAEKLIPYENNPLMLDFSTDNIYSEHMAKLVAWHRHYTRFWKESVLYCDHRWPEFINSKVPGYNGITGDGEPRFFNAVTGKKFSFLDGMELGRKIWNLDNAIWTLQGRHRDMVHFSDYIYHVPFGGSGNYAMYHLPGREKGRWDYIRVNGRYLDKAKFEEFKTRFYNLEEWDNRTGWPKRKTLESLGLKFVADELETKGKLGA
jgi:aldehyde:ferredoxin oxidoreductase